MTEGERVAAFDVCASYDRLEGARDQRKSRVLEKVDCKFDELSADCRWGLESEA